ncbi:MAG: DUF4430 domain-containing protein [Eubacterium sp.]|nr:DUF4430 domain-containing protein [Eubacterium sp.]
MLVFVLWVHGTLNSDGPYSPEEAISGLNSERSQVFLSGSNYAIDEDTKNAHEEEEKERSRILAEKRASHQQTATQKRLDETRGQSEVKQESGKGGGNTGESSKKAGEPKKAAEPEPENEPQRTPEPRRQDPKPTKPADPSKPSETDPDDDDEEDYYKKKQKDRDVLPTIKTSLRDGVSTKGETISFWVTATDYKKQNIPVFSNGEGRFTVYLNGEELTSTGTSGKKTNFRPAVKDGKNTVKITAVDRKGNKRTITRRVNCDTKQEAKPIGTVYVSIIAPSLGLDVIESNISVKIFEEEPTADILRDAFKKAGISSTMTDSYLQGISRPGIAAGTEIPEELLEEAEERRITIYDREDWPKGWEDRLFEKDFSNRSGWIYRVNGSMPNVGIGAYIPDDGDEIELEFILFETD